MGTDHTGEDRDRTANARDDRADVRDERAETRDERANARDERAETRERAGGGVDAGAVADRAGAMRDRKEGASDRIQAADDREAASADRVLARRERTISTVPLDGENVETERWDDARHWLRIYDDMIRFSLGVIDSVKRELSKLPPVAQVAAALDINFFEVQLAGYYSRLDLWSKKVWKLQGLRLDPNERVVRHKGKEATLTDREFELMQFLLDHPRRYYSVSQIAGFAWSGAALSP